MRKKLLSLLVLLMTAATGAWAQGYNVTFGGFSESEMNTTVNVAMLPQTFTTIGHDALYPWTVISTSGNLFYGATVTSGGEGKVSVSVPNDEEMSITVTGPFEGTATIHVTGEDDENRNISCDITVSCVAVGGASSGDSGDQTYSVTMKEGVKDADKWTISPASAAENETVTITYAGTKSVNSVTAKRKTATGNITVYFTDALDYGDVHVYYWTDGVDWPGTAMTYVETNGYSQKIYKAVIPATPEGVIFNGNGRQTGDITEDIADGSWWYTTDNNEVGYVGKYTENIEVTNVDDNKWTFTMPGCDVELEVEYKDAATGIESIDHEPLTIDHWYDLNGRKIQTPKQRGIYINNGKKVVIK